MRARVIPCLLLRRGGLVKTVKFKDAKYVGDPINAVRIFNDKEVDELIFLDIEATRAGTQPNYELIQDIASEAFMPFGYGGGITQLAQAERLFALGVEKVVINTAAYRNPSLITSIANVSGSQSVVASIDFKLSWRRRPTTFVGCGKTNTKDDPVEVAKRFERAGAGEIVLNAIHQDGTMSGYDLDMLAKVSEAVDVPVVALGGAGNLTHMKEAVSAGASAAAAGSMFVFHGKHRAVLLTYPAYMELESAFGK